MDLRRFIDMFKDARFHTLQSFLTTFNPFEVLKLKEYEIRHSNMIAWLIDPHENHGMDDFMLKILILEYIENQKIAHEILLKQKINAEVYREYKIDSKKLIDLLIVLDELKIVVLIENKVHSKEHKDQLKSYYDFVERKYPGYFIQAIYLTLSGEDPSDARFYALGYERLVEIITDGMNINNNKINVEQKSFIMYYVEGVKEILGMKNNDMSLMAKALYTQYREVIDYIIEEGISNKFMEAGRIFIDKNQLIPKNSNANHIFFSDTRIENIAEVDMQKWASDKPFAYWFRKTTDSRIGFIIEVGPVKNFEIRKMLLLELKEAGFIFQKNALNQDSKYTRIYSTYNEFNDWDEEDIIVEEMEKIFASTRSKRELIEQVIIKVFG